VRTTLPHLPLTTIAGIDKINANALTGPLRPDANLVFGEVLETEGMLDKTSGTPPAERLTGESGVKEGEGGDEEAGGGGGWCVGPVAKAGQDERLPRIVSGMTGIKIVGIAAGGAHTLLLTSKLARRQRLIARHVLAKIRHQNLARALHRWSTISLTHVPRIIYPFLILKSGVSAGVKGIKRDLIS
jgi:hypothetical protein